MSTTESIASSQTSLSSWRKSDTTRPWPVWHRYRRRGAVFPDPRRLRRADPDPVMLVLAYPIAFYCHRALARLCLSGANPPAISPKRWKSILAKPAGW